MSKYTIEFYSPEKHYEIFCEWWKEYKFPCLEQEALPKNGIVVYKDEKPICGGFLYITDSTFSIMEWIITKKGTHQETKSEGLDKLIKTMTAMAEREGCKIIFSSLNHPTLIERYQKHGFVASDKGMTNMVKRVGY